MLDPQALLPLENSEQPSNSFEFSKPTKIAQALDDESWVEAMQEELLQFKIQKVWTLVDLPYGKKAIGTKWVYRNKKDERGIVVRNKARLVAQGYKQEEGIDYDEVFAPVARIEAIRLFLAYASFMNFLVYQMDVKSAFLYGTIEEEVYVSQPPGFVDPEFLEKVYKVEKALYGLHQAPRAWYETLSTYLLDNGFYRGQIDKTLFIKRVKGDILLVQVYVDDIIFGSTKKSLCTDFEQIMHKRFQMSSMGELTFFLGLQVKQKEDGIFISQDKYVGEILKKFGFSSIRTASTPMETNKALTKDEDGEDVDIYLYRSMIGSLMYLTSSRPDIMFSVCACSRFQVQPKVSHLNAVKRIFRYLKGRPKLGLWYPKDSPFILEAFSDSDYAGASLDRKSTTRGLALQGYLINDGYVDLVRMLAIGTKWVFKNKRDKRSIAVKKARLVAQGFRQEEGIDYDEVFAPVARIEAIRLFLAFASFMEFPVYQMDVKSTFLYGTIEEEVYVHQPPGFVDPVYPNKVYKVIKALYGLHQAPRAWYETLSSFLLKNGFMKGTIEKTLFIKKNKSDIMLVQVYVDDIIFGSTMQSMCTEFEDYMHKRFQMSSMGELTFFLGLQVKQQPDGIFISQDKYVADILKKFDFCSIITATTHIASNKPLVKDEDGLDVDVHIYRSMIGSLMYLTASRLDIMFAVFACARFQVTPKASHLNAVKRIFRYLKHQPKLGLWYPRDSPFELEAFSDSDYGGASLDRKSTIGGCQFLGRRLISWQCKKQTIVANSTTKAEYVAATNCCGQLVSAASFVNTATPTLSTARLGIKVGAARQKFMLLVTVTTVDKDSSLFSRSYQTLKQISIKSHFRLPITHTLPINHIPHLNPSITSFYGELEFVDQHNMVACLEKTEGNSDFHEIVDFLASSLIHHALTISPPIYTSYIEQFWNTASSQTVNDVKQIDVIVDSKAVVVTKASIRSFLLFNDADGTACLTNEAVFQNLALMGYEVEGKGSGEPTEPQPTPSLTQPSIGDQPPETSTSHATTQDSRDSLEGTNGNEGDQVQTPHDSPLSGGHTSDKAKGALNLQELSVLCTNLSNRVLSLESIKDAQAVEISALKSRIKKLEKKCKPSISHHRAWLKSVKRLSMKKRFGKKESLTDDTEVVEDKGSGDKGGYAEELVSTARPKVSTVRQEDSIVKPRNPPTTTSIFDDEDITMAQTLIKMKQEKAKEKGVLIKDVDDSSRPARSILTLKPLPIIDPKDKGKGVLKESPVKKVKRSDLDAAQIAKDAEIARLVHEKELAEMEREREERQRQDQASVDYIVSLYDEVQAKMDVSKERKKLLAEERADAVRNKPPTRTQLRSLMMTYLKHTSKYRHNQLNKKTFEEIQALYIKKQERDAYFVPIGSERDEKMIDKMNKKAAGRRLKMKATKKSKRQKTDYDLEEEEQLRASLKIAPDEEEEIDYEVLGMRVFRANGSSRYIKTFTEMVSRFDRLDFIELHKERYPLIRETLERIMELRLTANFEGEFVFDLLRFIQKQIDEFGAKMGVRRIFECWFSD
ncbi:putative ribonuclease H-like domain-containing protein, partial [Tanacetum coccineum]